MSYRVTIVCDICNEPIATAAKVATARDAAHRHGALVEQNDGRDYCATCRTAARVLLRPHEPSESTYVRGCRCDGCKAAHAAARRRQRAARKARPVEPWQHGLASTYRDGACRCDRCRAAVAAAARDLRARRRTAA